VERRIALVRALWFGVLWDLAAFVTLLAMPSWLFQLFDHPVPAEPFLFRLAGLPLLMAPVVYAMAARDGRPDSPLVTASIGLRVVGAFGIATLLIAMTPAGALAYWSFVVVDLVLAGIYVALRR
jgi:hypothetical protein